MLSQCCCRIICVRMHGHCCVMPTGLPTRWTGSMCLHWVLVRSLVHRFQSTPRFLRRRWDSLPRLPTLSMRSQTGTMSLKCCLQFLFSEFICRALVKSGCCGQVQSLDLHRLTMRMQQDRPCFLRRRMPTLQSLREAKQAGSLAISLVSCRC